MYSGIRKHSHSSLITHFLSLFSERIEIITLFPKQAIFYQTLYRVENRGARFRIVLASLKESVQIKLLSFPEFKAFQNAFVNFIHGGIKDQFQAAAVSASYSLPSI
jgi:hypothetical protein